MDRREFPSLVPLSTLQYTLYRNLYPQLRFDDLAHPDRLLFMASPQAASPPQPIRSPSPASDSPGSTPQEPAQRSVSPAVTKKEPADEGHHCQWVDCDKVMPDPESLYNHLCNDHVGRKSTGNLCLTCKWKDCNTTCAKRDHITSHLRGMCPLEVLQ